MTGSFRSRGPVRSVTHAALVLAVLAPGAIGCGDGSGGEEPSESAGSTAAAKSAPPCGGARPAKAAKASYRAPGRTVAADEKLTAVVRTNCGGFAIALDAKRFPTAVSSFVFLARKGFYDGLPFDRAAAGTYVHGGNPPGPADGPGYSVTGEIPESFIYRHGTVAMSQSGEAPPGHAGSQFFIVVAKPWLDFSGVYAPIGVVSRGFDTLNQISQLGPPAETKFHNPGVVGRVGKLRRPVVIEKIAIEKG